MPAPLSDHQRAAWKHDGFLIIPQAVDRENLSAMQHTIEVAVEGMLDQLVAQGRITDTRPDLPFDRRFAVAAGPMANQLGRSWRKAIASRALFDLHASRPLVDIVAELTGHSTVVAHPAFNGRPKLPHQALTEVPWHQDLSYFGDIARHSLILTCWIPLVPVQPSNGCMQVLPGTQSLDHRPHRAEQRDGGFLEADMTGLDESAAVTCAMEPGDVLIFNSRSLHRSLPSTAETIRWSVDLRFIRSGDPGFSMGAADPNFRWVVQSPDEPPLSYDAWFSETQRWSW